MTAYESFTNYETASRRRDFLKSRDGKSRVIISDGVSGMYHVRLPSELGAYGGSPSDDQNDAPPAPQPLDYLNDDDATRYMNESHCPLCGRVRGGP